MKKLFPLLCLRVLGIARKSRARRSLCALAFLLVWLPFVPNAITSTSVSAQTWHSQYHRYGDWVNYLKGLAAQYPTLVTYTPSIGKSVEGRDIPVLKITGKSSTSPKQQAIFISGQHGREWISIAAPMYAAEQLILSYGSNSRITTLLDRYEFFFIPIVNPDGYEYTWTTNRLWRKNRAVVNGTKQGVDLDRNYPDHWANIGGASTSPSSDNYKGPSAGSEPEVKAVIAFFKTKTNFILAVDFQSYGQLILRPYGWTPSPSPDEAALTQVGAIAKNSIASVAGTSYVNERVRDLYMMTGTFVDWTYGLVQATGIKRPYAFQLLLTPSETDPYSWGYIVPPQNIIPVGKEALQAILGMSEFSLSHPLPAR